MNKDTLDNKNNIDEISSDRENIHENIVFNDKFQNNTFSLNNNSNNNKGINNQYVYQFQKIEKKSRLKLLLSIIFYLLSGCFLLFHSFHYIFSRNVRDK